MCSFFFLAFFLPPFYLVLFLPFFLFLDFQHPPQLYHFSPLVLTSPPLFLLTLGFRSSLFLVFSVVKIRPHPLSFFFLFPPPPYTIGFLCFSPLPLFGVGPVSRGDSDLIYLLSPSPFWFVAFSLIIIPPIFLILPNPPSQVPRD